MVKIYQVGGFVRDSLMGLQSKDLDYAVEASSYDEMVNWIKERGTIYLESPQYWTVRAHIPGKLPADFVLCRKDGQYTDGRRPDSVSVGTLLDDLSRRDFTVNAIARDEETGELIDPFNGVEDIKGMLLRCVGNSYDRFHEDALRMLRAIRFSITKGFLIGRHVWQSLNDEDLVVRLLNVSEERIQDELTKCFICNTSQTLSILQSLPLIRDVVFNGKLWLMPTMKGR